MRNSQSRNKRCLFRNGYFGMMVCVAVFVLFLVGLGFAGFTNAGMMIYPAKGQSAEQQQKDEFECHQWAVKQTGYDPTKAQQATQQQTDQSGKPVARGAAGGALIGLGIGSLSGNAGKGAAIGAGVGAVGGGARQRQQQQQQQAANQQAQAQQQAQIDNYNKAKAVCLEGKGYTVK